MALSRYFGNVLLKCTCTWVLLKQDSKQGEKHRKWKDHCLCFKK